MPHFVPHNWGWLEVITGPMFSGKSTELIRRLVHAQIAGQKVVAFKPSLDTRFEVSKIVSRTGTDIDCIVADTSDFLEIVDEYMRDDSVDVLAFDEVQFFNDDRNLFSSCCTKLTSLNKRVIVAGLDTDYLGNPFDTTASLMARADFVDKIHAVCTKCGEQAIMTARLVDSTDKILIGDKEAYTALCRGCHYKHIRRHRR